MEETLIIGSVVNALIVSWVLFFPVEQTSIRGWWNYCILQSDV